MHIRKLLSIACNIIVVIAVCLFITMSCIGIMCLFKHCKVMTPQCPKTSLLEIPIHTYTPTYTTIIDTDGMEHVINQRFVVGPSGSAILKDIDGHTVIFDKDKFHHGLNKTQCIKCYELSRLPNNN